MYITIAGIKRSGTTWLGNAVRIICQEAGHTAWMGEHYDLALKEDFEVTINKIHPYNDQIAKRSDYIFTSWRDIREIRSSWRRFSGESLAPILENQWLTWSHLWTLKADYLMPYRGILDCPEVIVDDIAKVLAHGKPGKPRLDISRVLRDRVLERLATEIVPPTDKEYDPVTCLFKNHITRPS